MGSLVVVFTCAVYGVVRESSVSEEMTDYRDPYGQSELYGTVHQ